MMMREEKAPKAKLKLSQKDFNHVAAHIWDAAFDEQKALKLHELEL